jgi:phage-related minor tail protein
VGASFKVELQELEQARNTLQGLLHDVFTDVASPVHPVTFQNNTASSIQQGQYSAQVHKMTAMDGGQSSSSFGPMDQAVPAISTLDSAHGAAHAAIISLINDLNTQINVLSDRATKTHQVYSQTEDALHVSVTNVAKNM